jgi:hypothetical protein
MSELPRPDASAVTRDAAAGQTPSRPNRRVESVPAVEPDETPATPSDERKLLIDAVTLLARNQSRAESELAQQSAESSRRMLALERRCLDLEQRLGGIQEELRKLSREVLLSADPDSQQRLAELRGQLARLAQRSDVNATPANIVAMDFDAVHPVPADAPVAPVEPPTPVPPPAAPGSNSAPRPLWRSSNVVTQDNAGLLLIGVGAVAVLFAILTQIHV